VRIEAPPDLVWQVVEDPAWMGEWNPKVTGVELLSSGSRSQGSRFRVDYTMRGKSARFSAEIEEYRQPERLVLRLTEGYLPPGVCVRETYELRPVSSGTRWGRVASKGGGLGAQHTRLIRTIDLSASGLSLIVRVVLGLLSRFGKPVEKRYLERLKEIVETLAGG
jgi:uncharacterized protein YndB with AHSA1/START domain